MTLKENLKIIIDKGTGEVLDDCVIDRLVKRILDFKDEWNLIVKQQNFHITIGNVDSFNENDYYNITIPRRKQQEELKKKSSTK